MNELELDPIIGDYDRILFMLTVWRARLSIDRPKQTARADRPPDRRLMDQSQRSLRKIVQLTAFPPPVAGGRAPRTVY